MMPLLEIRRLVLTLRSDFHFGYQPRAHMKYLNDLPTRLPYDKRRHRQRLRRKFQLVIALDRRRSALSIRIKPR